MEVAQRGDFVDMIRQGKAAVDEHTEISDRVDRTNERSQNAHFGVRGTVLKPSR